MSATALPCPQCGTPCTYAGVQPARDGEILAYAVTWACEGCGGRYTDLSRLGPINPFAAACLNCGSSMQAGDDHCKACGILVADTDAFLGIHEPARRKPVGNAKVAFAKGYFRQGMGLLNIAMAADTSDLEAWEMKLDFLLRLGYVEEAKAFLEAGVESGAPKSLYRQLASLYQDLEAWDEAAEALKIFVTESDAPLKEKAEELSNLGNILAELGALDDAETAHVEASKLEPVNARIAQNHAAFLVSLGRVEEAEPICAQALLVATDNAERADLLCLQAFIHAESGDADLALATLRLAFSLGKEDTQALTLLGRLQAQAGEYSDSKDTFEKLLTMEPDNEVAIAAIHELTAILNA